MRLDNLKKLLNIGNKCLNKGIVYLKQRVEAIIRKIETQTFTQIQANKLFVVSTKVMANSTNEIYFKIQNETNKKALIFCDENNNMLFSILTEDINNRYLSSVSFLNDNINIFNDNIEELFFIISDVYVKCLKTIEILIKTVKLLNNVGNEEKFLSLNTNKLILTFANKGIFILQ